MTFSGPTRIVGAAEGWGMVSSHCCADICTINTSYIGKMLLFKSKAYRATAGLQQLNESSDAPQRQQVSDPTLESPTLEARNRNVHTPLSGPPSFSKDPGSLHVASFPMGAALTPVALAA